jgi:hypothetical protein
VVKSGAAAFPVLDGEGAGFTAQSSFRLVIGPIEPVTLSTAG